MCTTLLANATINNMYYGKCKAFDISKFLWETLYYQGVMDTGMHKSKYHWADFSWTFTIKSKGDNISIVCTMVSFKLNVMHDEDDTLHSSPMIHYINAYPS